MNNPRFVSLLLKIVEIINNRIISKRFTPAIIAPIIVIQFLLVGDSFIAKDFRYNNVKTREP